MRTKVVLQVGALTLGVVALFGDLLLAGRARR